MFKVEKLWTSECVDVQVANHMEDGWKKMWYQNLDGPQLLQIFRTTFDTNTEEIKEGLWLQRARDVLPMHFHAIEQHLKLSKGMVIDRLSGQVVGEGSGPNDKGIQPMRIMYGLKSFKERDGYDKSWTPGLLFLRGRLIKLMRPWAPDNMDGVPCLRYRKSCWISEVSLGFRQDGRHWEPRNIKQEADRWLEEAREWEIKDEYDLA